MYSLFLLIVIKFYRQQQPSRKKVKEKKNVTKQGLTMSFSLSLFFLMGLLFNEIVNIKGFK